MGRAPAPFIVGVGRSGTTLLRLMLDSHPALAIPPETNFGDAAVGFERAGVAGAVEAIVGGELWTDYRMPAGEFATRVESVGAKTLGDVLRAFFELYAERLGKPRWGNKTPYYLARMTMVQQVLPEARFVHVIRDGRDVARSTVPLWFGPDDVAGAAREWAWGLHTARRQAPELHFYTEVRYEDLVREPAATLSQICEFAELDWEPAMLDYHRHAAERLSAELGDSIEAGRRVTKAERLASWRLVDKPPLADRAESWRREMSRADVVAFERVAADALQSFGYELS